MYVECITKETRKKCNRQSSEEDPDKVFRALLSGKLTNQLHGPESILRS